MSPIFKIGKVVLPGLLLMMATACAPGNREHGEAPGSGNYNLYVQGTESLQLNGQIIYEWVQEEKEDGPQKVLKFHLTNSSEDNSHYLGFIIANPGDAAKAQSFKVNGNVECFLSQYKGVFAFASINILGEYPFFAKKGKFSIVKMVDDELQGNISFTMENSNGKTLDIEGDFNAIRKGSTFTTGGQVGQAL